MTDKISKGMKIADVLTAHPEVAGILIESGFHCMGCSFAEHESLEQGFKAHGFSDEKIDELVAKMNKKTEEEKKE